ncbi:hypothetical protein AA313_de0207208 [Arthrobotrys entomopaga]|nr:hypothetical protein AA313_de0207208 [Arthrobotrys entomopaga]
MSVSFGADIIHGSEDGDFSIDSDESDDAIDSRSASPIAEEYASFRDTSDVWGSNKRLLMEPEIDFSRSPHASFLSEPPSTFMRRQSLNSLNVILASRVRHMMPRKVGSMVFDEESQVWRHRQNSVEDPVHASTTNKDVEDAEGRNSIHSAGVDDPFYEISDLTASPQAMVPGDRDESGKGGYRISSLGSDQSSSPTPQHRDVTFRSQQQSSDSPNMKDLHLRDDENSASSHLNLEDFSRLNLSTGTPSQSSLNVATKTGVRIVSPNFDPKKNKALLESEYSPFVTEKSENIRPNNDSIVLQSELREVYSAPKVATPPTMPEDTKANHHGGFRDQSTPQSLQQYTLSVQPNGRPMNRALLSIRKSELSFWNTPLTDISYHFLEGDSRLHSAFSRGYHPRNGKAVRKFAADKSSLVVRNMVKHLTDNDMFGPYWDQNKALQIQQQGLEHLGDLASFHPNLVEVNLEDNQLTHLTGMPVTVRDLKVAGNQISSLTAWNHLANLQFLDISRNKIDNLSGILNIAKPFLNLIQHS